ncbi:MAG: FAD-dependent oxidoreductase [Oscillospiraceae bacterium]|nr:FAD-dependent oxidoreductase [Oscillospiraceae bacterium]
MEPKQYVTKTYDVVVIGGGLSGVCAAIASARHGARTALIQNRHVLGGNASSEIRMHICGADCHGRHDNARETGILEEILLTNREINPQHSFFVLDTVLWEKVHYQENLELFLNTHILEVETSGDAITAVCGHQWTTENNYRFTGTIFMDCTGDGVVAYRAGADTRQGREASWEYEEPHAPEMADTHTMGNTIMFIARDTGHPVKFKKPFWAYTVTDEDLRERGHSHLVSQMEHYGIDSGFWWLELGGTQDVIKDGEHIRDELLKYLYGIWDHIKNGGDHGAENYELEWVQFLPGKRESRRILGDYILREQDVAAGTRFADAVAYGGWPMDIHPPEGFFYQGHPTNFIQLDDVYTIPYRCYYSRNISNLMMAGRNISATHMAFGSVRVMATCAVGGQAAGTAAALAVKYNCTPRQVGQNHIRELQQTLLRDDCYIPGICGDDEQNLAFACKVCASSYQPDWEPELAVNGISRIEGSHNNGWRSAPLKDGEQWLELQLENSSPLSDVEIKFDSDLNNEIMISISETTRNLQTPGIPRKLIRSYRLELFHGETQVYCTEEQNNIQRFCRHSIPEEILADRIRITCLSTWGEAYATIYEVRAYGR